MGHAFRPYLSLSAVLGAVLLVAACTPSGTPSTSASPESWASAIGSTPVVPLIASSELARGRERFLFTLIDQANQVVAEPSVAVRIRFFDLAQDPESPASEADALFFWIIEGERGLYRAPVTFPAAGRWGAEFLIARVADAVGSSSPPSPDPLASPVTVRVAFSVRDHPSTPAIGDPAPAADTPTLEDVAGDPRKISTDPDPDARLYQLSIREALEARKAFLLVFATPAFCQTATCGPTLEVVREVLADYPALAAIHVEPYQLAERDGALQPVLDADGNLQPVPAVRTWGLVTEPYTFVVDAAGTVVERFEGPLDPNELREALDAVSSR